MSGPVLTTNGLKALVALANAPADQQSIAVVREVLGGTRIDAIRELQQLMQGGTITLNLAGDADLTPLGREILKRADDIARQMAEQDTRPPDPAPHNTRAVFE